MQIASPEGNLFGIPLLITLFIRTQRIKDNEIGESATLFRSELFTDPMLADKLHKALYGKARDPKGSVPESSELRSSLEIDPVPGGSGGVTQTGQISIQYVKPSKSAPLSDLRNRNALRIPRGSCTKILQHKHAEALILYLELKSLCTASIVFNQRGNIPYERIREFTGESFTTIRNRIRVLKKLSLCWFTPDKDLRLATFDHFRTVIEIRTRRTHKLKNNSETKTNLKALAIYENLEKQQYIVKKKIFQRELLEMKIARTLDPVNPTPSTNARDCQQKFWSPAYLRKFRKHFESSWEFYKRKYERIYNYEIQQTAMGFPSINPEVTLSCNGTAKVCGLTSKSSGHRVQSELQRSGLLTKTGAYIIIPERSPAIFEQHHMKIRTDLFGYKYRTRREGKVTKYFRTCVNQLFPDLSTIMLD